MNEGAGTPGGDVPATLPPGPAVARTVLGDALPAVERYAHLLGGEGVTWGLLGPREVPRLWERHLLNCAVVADLVPHGASVTDLGSGAGLPGIVIALMRADVDVELLEPMARRTRFLSLCVQQLGLEGRVRVTRGRAEDLGGEPRADVVVARAVAPLGRLAAWAMPLVRPGGEFLAVKGRGAAEEVRASRRDLRRLGVQSVQILPLGAGVLDVPTTVVRIVREGSRRAHRGG